MNGIPVLKVEADCIARAWELSLIELYEKGGRVKTQYDKPEDPPSRDATMIIMVNDPCQEPLIHKDFPGGLEDLQDADGCRESLASAVACFSPAVWR